MRTLGIPAEVEELISLFRTDAPLKAHPAYVAAKVGDPAAAVALVADLAPPLREEVAPFGPDALYNASRGGRIHPDRALLRQLEQRFPAEIRQLFGIEVAALTAEEARYLIGFRTADELRGRALAAAQARIERLRAKGVHLEREMMGYGPDWPGSGSVTT